VDFLVSRSRELSARDDEVRGAGKSREARAEALALVEVDPAADARREAMPQRPGHAALKAVNST
jgi:hypothetical protein